MITIDNYQKVMAKRLPFLEWWTLRCFRSSLWSSPPDSPSAFGPAHHVYYYDDIDAKIVCRKINQNEKMKMWWWWWWWWRWRLPERAYSNWWRFSKHRRPPNSKFALNHRIILLLLLLLLCWIDFNSFYNLETNTDLFKLCIKFTTVKDQLCNFRNINILKCFWKGFQLIVSGNMLFLQFFQKQIIGSSVFWWNLSRSGTSVNLMKVLVISRADEKR